MEWYATHSLSLTSAQISFDIRVEGNGEPGTFGVGEGIGI